MAPTAPALRAPAQQSARKRRSYAPRVSPEQRRGQLLDAALRIIARDGYTGISMEAIAREANVTKPVVYGVYDKLPNLLNDLLDRTQSQALGQLLETVTAQQGDTDNGAREVTRTWLRTVRANPTTWAPILLTGANTPQVVLDRIESGRSVIRQHVAQLLLGAGKPSAARRKRVDLASQAIVAAAEHFGRALLTRPDSIDDDLLAELFDDLTRVSTTA